MKENYNSIDADMALSGVDLSGQVDPNGLDVSDPGAKMDAGKPMLATILDGFPRALEAVARVGTYGHVHKGYSLNSWQEVPDGVRRYRDAEMRHRMAGLKGEVNDPESKLPHEWHRVWNALAQLELQLRAEAA